MSIETSATKLYLRELPPLQVHDLLEEYKIPTPYKEVLIACCANRLDAYPAIDYIEETFNIHISYWNYVKILKEALIMFRRTEQYQQYKNSPKTSQD